MLQYSTTAVLHAAWIWLDQGGFFECAHERLRIFLLLTSRRRLTFYTRHISLELQRGTVSKTPDDYTITAFSTRRIPGQWSMVYLV